MLMHLSEYHRPKTMSATLHLLARQSPRSVPLAGGTWLLAQHDPTNEAVVDLSALKLAFVEQRGHRLRLGAMTTPQTLITDQKVSTLGRGLLAEADGTTSRQRTDKCHSERAGKALSSA